MMDNADISHAVVDGTTQ